MSSGYGEEPSEPQAQPIALKTAIALRDCALRYEPPAGDGASSSLTDTSPVAAALLVGSLDTCMESTCPVTLWPDNCPICSAHSILMYASKGHSHYGLIVSAATLLGPDWRSWC